MGNGSPKVRVGEPASFTGAELDDFSAFVLAGGEVAAEGLRERVEKAAQLAFARDNECLLGVAGLKKPDLGYRSRIENNAKVKLLEAALPLELGWVFILPSARGKKLSSALCRLLVARADGNGIFATSRTDNIAMHRTLEKLSFKKTGQEWPSKQRNSKLVLFVRNAV